VIAVVLLANLALLGYTLLRGRSKDAPATPPAATASVATTPAASVDVVPAGALPPPALPASSTVPASAPISLPANGSAGTSATAAAGGVIMQSNAVVSPDNSSAPGTGASTGSPASNSSTGNIPSDDDLRATGVTLPELRLSLHVYDDVAANRYVLLNSSRLREGQETAEGVMVERIDPTGVVLSWRGRRFRMHPGN
jgi:general secretion pathway protein B